MTLHRPDQYSVGNAPMHSDVTLEGGRYSKNGIFQKINLNYLSVSEMSKASKDILLSVKRQSVFRVYDSEVRCS